MQPSKMVTVACIVGMLSRPVLSWKLVVQGGQRRPSKDELLLRWVWFFGGILLFLAAGHFDWIGVTYRLSLLGLTIILFEVNPNTLVFWGRGKRNNFSGVSHGVRWNGMDSGVRCM